MQDVNINKLRGKIVENGLSVSELAACIGIDPSTLYRKIGDGGSSILVGEANKIVKALHLSPEDAMSIFFTNYVA